MNAWSPLVLVACIALPVVVIMVASRWGAGWVARQCKGFVAALDEGGLAIPPAAEPGAFRAEGTVDGVPLAVDHQTERRGKEGKQTAVLTHLRVTRKVELSNAAVFAKDRVSLNDVGSMAEVTLDPTFGTKYRAFAEDPAQLRAWLSPEVQQALVVLGPVEQLRVEDGALRMVTVGPVASARGLIAMAEMVAAIASHQPFSGSAERLRVGWGNPLSWAMGKALLGALLLALAAPFFIPGAASLASPVACERGELRPVASGENINLYCVDESGTRVGDALFLTPAAFFFGLTFLPLALLFGTSAYRRANARAPEGRRPSEPKQGVYR